MGVDQAMGGGDIKMSMMIGAFVGVEGIALTVFIASALAIVIALARSIPAALARNEDSDMQMVGLIRSEFLWRRAVRSPTCGATPW